MNFENELHQIFSADITVPDTTTLRIAETLQQIRLSEIANIHTRSSASKFSIRNKRTVMLLAAVLLMLICAGTALAYTINHYDFINAIWRDDNTEEQLASYESNPTFRSPVLKVQCLFSHWGWLPDDQPTNGDILTRKDGFL